ncbi:MAG: hypothetical protein H7066_15910 [Cytophagaceae bacterium]|nr:hypothetical protein [Gemmatimonadaceae bacterium]
MAAAPLAAFAQGRIVRPNPPSQIGVTLPSPPPPRMEHRGWPDDRLRHDRLGVGGGWSYPIVVGSASYAAPQPVPYPVPVYYPVRIREPRPEPVVPAVPYNPAASRTVLIGRGGDGGAGVMHLERLPRDSLRVTWRGSVRPVREVRLYLADANHQSLVTRPVTLNRPDARFSLGGHPRPAAFVGLAVTYADGAMQVTLVPLEEPR